MIGAVFHQELLLAGRRQRFHFLRWLYLGMLLLHAMSLFASINLENARSGAAYRAFFGTFLWQHFAFLMILTPVLTAGAIADEKSGGTLEYLLIADFRPRAIILGKLLGRSWAVLMLSLTGVPIVSFLATLAHFDPGLQIAVVVASFTLILGIGSVGLLLSVWCRYPRDAIVCSYLLGVFALILDRYLRVSFGLRWLETLDPNNAITLDEPTQDWSPLGRFVASWLMLGFVCCVIAAWRLRPAYLKQCRPPRAHARWWYARKPAVRGNPVLWRERYVLGFAPLDWLRVFPTWLGMLTVFAATGVSLCYFLSDALPPSVDGWALFWRRDMEAFRRHLAHATAAAEIVRIHGFLTLFVMTLIVAVRASGAITLEREQGTWTHLLLTPLTTRSIVRGKVWGIFWAWLPFLGVYACAALPLAWFVGAEALLWQFVLIAVAPLTIYYVIAVGLWCSVQAKSSWRGLLMTLATCYFTVQAFAVAIGCLGLTLFGAAELGFRMLNLFADVANPLEEFPVAPTLSLVAIVSTWWFLTQLLLRDVENHINREERTKVVTGPYSYVDRDRARRYEERLAEEQRRKIAEDDVTIPLSGEPALETTD